MNDYFRNLETLTAVAKKPAKPFRVPSLAPKAAETFVDLREDIIPMLLSLGPSLHLDTVLFYKIIRLSKAALGVSVIQYKILNLTVFT
jgi:THO complex subunit 2